MGVLLGGVRFRVHDGLLGAAAKIRRGVYPVVAGQVGRSTPVSRGTSSWPDPIPLRGIQTCLTTARAKLERTVRDACADDPWLDRHPVEVEWWGGQFASGEVPATSDLPDRISAAHAGGAGDDAPVWGAPYGSDLRLLTGKGGIPTVQYGTGDAALAHAPDENVPLREVVTCARALALLAVDYCGVG